MSVKMTQGAQWDSVTRSPATCVHCGGTVPALYRRYSATVLKEMTCSHCNQVADKYIEYDPVIILIDLVLLNKEAFRHILYNTNFTAHWKLAVVMVLIEGYVWYDATDKAVIPASTSGRLDSPTPDDLLDSERFFYMICLQCLLASVIFFGTVIVLSWYLRPPGLTHLLLWKALVLGSFGVFFMVPALIWLERTRVWIDMTFIWGYTFLALLQVHSVVCKTPRVLSALIMATGLGIKFTFKHLLTSL